MGRNSAPKTTPLTTRAKTEPAAAHEKKLYWYTSFGRIEISEQVFKQGKGKALIRPFSQSAAVECRGYSVPLQRIITDFGSDVAFGRITKKLKEHYGISVPISSARKITQKHANSVLEAEKTQINVPSFAGVEKLIAQIDGSMIPIVETTDLEFEGKSLDRRKDSLM